MIGATALVMMAMSFVALSLASEPPTFEMRRIEALARCLADPFDRKACTLARQSAGNLQFEGGSAPNVVYRACETNRGVCLELATLKIKRRLGKKPFLAALETLIIFDLNSYKLRGDELHHLDAIAKALRVQNNRVLGFAIIGHTDALGSDQANRQLSRNRAKAVRDYLVNQGVAVHRLRVLAAGEHVLRFAKAPKARGNRRVAFARITPRSRSVITNFSKICGT